MALLSTMIDLEMKQSITVSYFYTKTYLSMSMMKVREHNLRTWFYIII